MFWHFRKFNCTWKSTGYSQERGLQADADVAASYNLCHILERGKRMDPLINIRPTTHTPSAAKQLLLLLLLFTYVPSACCSHIGWKFVPQRLFDVAGFLRFYSTFFHGFSILNLILRGFFHGSILLEYSLYLKQGKAVIKHCKQT